MPENRPIWTELGVSQLGAPQMHFEITVEARKAKDEKKKTEA